MFIKKFIKMFINGIFLVLILSQTVLTIPRFIFYSVGNRSWVSPRMGRDVAIRGINFTDLGYYNISVRNASSLLL